MLHLAVEGETFFKKFLPPPLNATAKKVLATGDYNIESILLSVK